MVEHFKIEKWFNELSEMEFKQKIAELVIKNLLKEFDDNDTHLKGEKTLIKKKQL